MVETTREAARGDRGGKEGDLHWLQSIVTVTTNDWLRLKQSLDSVRLSRVDLVHRCRSRTLFTNASMQGRKQDLVLFGAGEFVQKLVADVAQLGRRFTPALLALDGGLLGADVTLSHTRARW